MSGGGEKELSFYGVLRGGGKGPALSGNSGGNKKKGCVLRGGGRSRVFGGGGGRKKGRKNRRWNAEWV